MSEQQTPSTEAELAEDKTDADLTAASRDSLLKHLWDAAFHGHIRHWLAPSTVGLVFFVALMVRGEFTFGRTILGTAVAILMSLSSTLTFTWYRLTLNKEISAHAATQWASILVGWVVAISMSFAIACTVLSVTVGWPGRLSEFFLGLSPAKAAQVIESIERDISDVELQRIRNTTVGILDPESTLAADTKSNLQRRLNSIEFRIHEMETGWLIRGPRVVYLKARLAYLNEPLTLAVVNSIELPDDQNLIDNLAVARARTYMRVGANEEARSVLDGYLRRNPDDASAHLAYATLHARSGNWESCGDWARKAWDAPSSSFRDKTIRAAAVAFMINREQRENPITTMANHKPHLRAMILDITRLFEEYPKSNKLFCVLSTLKAAEDSAAPTTDLKPWLEESILFAIANPSADVYLQLLNTANHVVFGSESAKEIEQLFKKVEFALQAPQNSPRNMLLLHTYAKVHFCSSVCMEFGTRFASGDQSKAGIETADELIAFTTRLLERVRRLDASAQREEAIATTLPALLYCRMLLAYARQSPQDFECAAKDWVTNRTQFGKQACGLLEDTEQAIRNEWLNQSIE